MRAVIFSGTSDGRELISFLSECEISTLACVATEYGADLIEKQPFVTVHTGRMGTEEMCRQIRTADFVIDATHPYAEEATRNISLACERENVRYMRLLREETLTQEVIFANSISQAVDILKKTKGKIFVATGSKQLHEFCNIADYKNRLAARVLPFSEAREKCREIGIENVIFEKGPFTTEQNRQHFEKYGCEWLVTKSSGRAGGFDEKIKAAKSLGMKIIVIERPAESGMTAEEIKTEVKKCLTKF